MSLSLSLSHTHTHGEKKKQRKGKKGKKAGICLGKRYELAIFRADFNLSSGDTLPTTKSRSTAVELSSHEITNGSAYQIFQCEFVKAKARTAAALVMTSCQGYGRMVFVVVFPETADC